MKAERLALLAADGISFDLETHLIQPGLLAPPLVCGSVAAADGNKIEGALLDRDSVWHAFLTLVENKATTLIGANIAFDLLVMAVEGAKRGVDLMPMIFDLYDRGAVFDVQIAEALHAVALGMLGKDPRSGMPLINPETGKRGRYSLATCVDIVLGRSNAKANDRYRLSYALLEDVPIEDWPLEARTYPVDDAVNTLEVALVQAAAWGLDDPRRNLHDLSAQVYAAWAMHLGASWGFIPDPVAVDALAARAATMRAEGEQEFHTAGLLREDGSKDTALVKTLVARAFGASGQCETCGGSGKVAGKGKKPIGCKACASTGFDLDSAPVPRTPTGGVETGRDTLTESGDELLMAFAAFSEADKIESTYLPWLRSGIDEQGRPRAINLRPNVLLDTGRASYGDVVQLLPRDMGIRECIVPRPGYVFCSCDYEGLELTTHGQSCLWIVGWSRLAEALNGGIKVHNALAANMAAMSYDDYQARFKGDAKLKSYRQAAKPANFGFPGGMGAAKLVLQQRKSGPDTTAPDGTKYKGLRFCILTDGAERCGTEKITEYKGRPLAPTCKRCIEAAERLRAAWFKTFPENRIYFERVNDTLEQRGEVVQHISKRVRGGLEFCAAANGYFQALAADGAKLALCRVAREQYVNRGTALYGTRTILFAHDELMVEMPESIAHEAAARLSEVMEGAMQEFCPDMKPRAEPCLMRRWYKSAEPVFDVSGRLIPWEPK